MVFDSAYLRLPEGMRLPPGWEAQIEISDWGTLGDCYDRLYDFMVLNSQGPTIGAAVIVKRLPPEQEWRSLIGQFSDAGHEAHQRHRTTGQGGGGEGSAAASGEVQGGESDPQADLFFNTCRLFDWSRTMVNLSQQAFEEVMGWFMFETSSGWCYMTPEEFDVWLTGQRAQMSAEIAPMMRGHFEESRNMIVGQLELDAQIRQEFLDDPFSIDTSWQLIASSFSTAMNQVDPGVILGHIEDVSGHVDQLEALLAQSATGIQPQLALMEQSRAWITVLQDCLNSLRRSARTYVEMHQQAAQVGLDILRVTEAGLMIIAGQALAAQLVGVGGITSLTAEVLSGAALTAYSGAMHAVGEFTIGGDVATITAVTDSIAHILVDTLVSGIFDYVTGRLSEYFVANIGRLLGSPSSLPGDLSLNQIKERITPLGELWDRLFQSTGGNIVRNQHLFLRHLGGAIQEMGESGISCILNNVINSLGDPGSFTVQDLFEGMLEQVVVGGLYGALDANAEIGRSREH